MQQWVTRFDTLKVKHSAEGQIVKGTFKLNYKALGQWVWSWMGLKMMKIIVF